MPDDFGCRSLLLSLFSIAFLLHASFPPMSLPFVTSLCAFVHLFALSSDTCPYTPHFPKPTPMADRVIIPIFHSAYFLAHSDQRLWRTEYSSFFLFLHERILASFSHLANAHGGSSILL